MTIQLVSRSVWHNPGNRGQRLRRMIRAAKWQLYKRLIRKPKEIYLINGKRFLLHSDCVISSALVYADYPEFEELRFVRRNLLSEDSIIDVGANVGHIGLLLSDIVQPGNIYAFEPTPLTFKRLKANWELNEVSQPPHLYPVAVGDVDGQGLMPDPQKPDTMNSIISAHSAVECDGRVISVPVIRLDSMVATWLGKSIGLLKIDVEGHEDAVFDGASAFICDQRPRLIMFESLKGRLTPTIATVLTNAEYEVFQLEDGKPDFGRNSAQNLFACPREMRDQLKVEDRSKGCKRAGNL